MVVEQPEEDHPYLDVRIDLAAGMLECIADRLRAKGVILRLQVGVAEQHTNPLVEGDEFLVAVLTQLGCHVVELERLVEIVFPHQIELERRRVKIGEALAYFFHPVAAYLELPQIVRPELLRDGLALLKCLVPGL